MILTCQLGRKTDMSKLDLTQREDGSFVLIKTYKDGNTSSLVMSEDDAIDLCMSVENIAKKILEHRYRDKTGVTPIYGTIVTDIELKMDIHKSEIHMEITPKTGPKDILIVPLQVAQKVADSLVERLREIRASLSGKKH
jgi:hypothetical protein